MIAILALNLLAVAAAILAPNAVLAQHAYLFFGLQLATLVPHLLGRAFYARNLFLPSLFALTYALVNEAFGSFLVPRHFGWYKGYAPVALGIERYNLIVPYLMVANLLLFLLALAAIQRMARSAPPGGREAPGPGARGTLLEAGCVGVFVLATVAGGFATFSLQLASLVVHLGEVARRRAPYRLLVSLAYLVGMLASSYQSKRQIAIVLFLVMFMEVHRRAAVVRFTPPALAGFGLAGGGFLALVLAASVLRGYGGYQVTNPLQALAAIPRYATSDIFVDGLVDNLELNYSYGSAIAAMDLVLEGRLDYQYGASLWKVAFLPIPRSVFPDKPESVMQLFTQVFAPGMWATGGSLPVVFSVDMFINFGVLGLLPFALVWLVLDRVFQRFLASGERSFGRYASLFLLITALILARGSGLELYLLTFLLGFPVLVLAAGSMSVARALVPLAPGRD